MVEAPTRRAGGSPPSASLHVPGAPARRPRGRLGLGWLMLAALLAATPARAADEVELADVLYAVHELDRGGEPLWNRSFALGWPTDQRHRALTGFARDAALDGLTAVLTSRAGAGLVDSGYIAARRAARVEAGERVPTADDQLRDELRWLADLAGYAGPLDGLEPVFLPARRARPDLRGALARDRLGSWAWREPAAVDHSLAALGFALLAETDHAAREIVRRHDDGRVGATARDGFLGLLALQAACAQVHELRTALVLDSDEGEISPTTELLALSPRRYHYPSVWLSDREGGRLAHAPDGEDGRKSQLGGQAALLLGLSRLAALIGPRAPSAVVELFAEREVGAGGRAVPFDPGVPVQVMETALFTFRSLRTLHVSVEGSGRASSVAGPDGPGTSVSPVDLGLCLLAIEAFLEHVHAPDSWRKSGLESQLAEEHDKARRLVGPLSSMIRTWQQNEPGFYDGYDVRTSARVVRSRSLAAQGFAIRGLLATHRVVSKGDPSSPFLAGALEAARWLDQNMWDRDAKAYVETDSQGERRAPLQGALAVLGALRELGLETGDGRFLLRYRQYLESLKAAGLLREGSDVAPGPTPVVGFGSARGAK